MASTPPAYIRQRVTMDLSKALSVMGLTNWSNLEPGKHLLFGAFMMVDFTVIIKMFLTHLSRIPI